MATNRLRLNWNLQTTEERLAFLNSYLPTLSFAPTEHELDTLSDYLCSNRTGKFWQRTPSTARIESLDALREAPAFNENSLHPVVGTSSPYKLPKVRLDRAALSQPLRETLTPLWRQIDQTELTLNYYEQQNGKRSKPPRAELRQRLSPSDAENAILRALSLTPYDYLKLKRQLVDLRREQYTIKDAIQGDPMPTAPTPSTWEPPISFATLPLSCDWDDAALFYTLFPLDHFPTPSQFTPSQLRAVSNALWAPALPNSIDLRDPAILFHCFDQWAEISTDPAFRGLLRVLQSYISLSKLDQWHLDLLHLKQRGASNQQIQSHLSTTYSRFYNINYISTIYHQKILKSIAETATIHFAVISNLFFEENFKQCKDCGRWFLKDEYFFVHKKKSSDGFECRCKACTKLQRERRKNG